MDSDPLPEHHAADSRLSDTGTLYTEPVTLDAMSDGYLDPKILYRRAWGANPHRRSRARYVVDRFRQEARMIIREDRRGRSRPSGWDNLRLVPFYLLHTLVAVVCFPSEYVNSFDYLTKRHRTGRYGLRPSTYREKSPDRTPNSFGGYESSPEASDAEIA